MNSRWTRSLLATTALVLTGSAALAAELNFTPVPFAATDAQKREVLASAGITIGGQTHPIGFTVLARSGDQIGDAVFGTLVDKDGQPVLSADGSVHISSDADFSSLIADGVGEYARYLRENGAGDEFRANDEIITTFFESDGEPKPAALEDLRDNLASLLYPSRRRALDLDKAYRTIVIDQDFVHGRDALITPAQNVHQEVEQDEPTGIADAVPRS